MKLINSDLKKGRVKVKIENLDDLWYLNQIIESHDIIKGKTFRKIKIGQEDQRKQKVSKKTVFLVVEVENVELTLFPKLGVQLQDVVIADDPAFGSKPFLRVPSVQVAVQWRPLLQRRIQVESVLVEDPVLQVIRSTKGDLNNATIGKIPSTGTASSEIAEPKNSVSPLLGVLAVKQFSMTGGTLQYEDRTHRPPAMTSFCIW